MTRHDEKHWWTARNTGWLCQQCLDRVDNDQINTKHGQIKLNGICPKAKEARP